MFDTETDITAGLPPSKAPTGRDFPLHNPSASTFLRRISLLALVSVALLLALAACGDETSTSELSTPEPEASERSSTSSDPAGTSRPSDGSTGQTSSSSGQLPSSSQGDGASGGENTAGDSDSGPTPTPTPLPEFPAEAVDGDYDYDNDGLLEIRTLAQLDAMRLDPEGTGFVQEGREQYFAAFPGTGGPSGCPNQTCAGYELAAHLDFDTNGNGEADEGDDYWNGGKGWEPLPRIPDGVTFDGNGYTIHNLFMAGQGGFFVANEGKIANLNLKAVDVFSVVMPSTFSAFDALGGLVIGNGGVVHKCTVTGEVAGYTSLDQHMELVGGLIGINDEEGTVTRSTFEGSVSGPEYVGGLIGLNLGTVKDSMAAGEVYPEFRGHPLQLRHGWRPASRDYVQYGSLGVGLGGLIGLNRGTIENSISRSNVSGVSDVGGLVGTNGGPVVDSLAEGNVSGAAAVGGLVGYNQRLGTHDKSAGNVAGSEARGNVSGYVSVGGLAGESWGTITTSVATGGVSGNQNVGGLIGNNSEASVSESTASGDVVGGEYVGGLIGSNGRFYETPGGGSRTFRGGTISQSAVSGDVVGGQHVGGLLGSNYGANATVEGSTASGEVLGLLNVGGLVGHHAGDGTIVGGSASGRVSGGENVGGLVGYSGASISDSNSTGDVAGVTYRGELVGVNDGGDIENSEGSGTVSLNESPPQDAGDRDLLSSLGFTKGYQALFDENGRAVAVQFFEETTLPPEIGSLVHLEVLHGDQSRPFKDDIPPEIGNLVNLQYLSFGGNIPAEIGKLTNLKYASFNGNIPPEIGNLANLEHLSLATDGPLPPGIGNLAGLKFLEIGVKRGPREEHEEIPPELGNLTNLTHLELDGSFAADEIPAEVGNLTNLKYLRLSGKFRGCVPASLSTVPITDIGDLPFCTGPTSKKALTPAGQELLG